MTDKSVTKFYEIKWMVPEDAAENVAHLNKVYIEISFIIVEFSFHAEKKKFIVLRSENRFSCPRAGKQAGFQL